MVYDRPANGGGGKTILYQNKGNSNNWVNIKLEGSACNRDAYGAKISLHIGDKKLIHEIEGGSSHTSKNSAFSHFGLAQEDHIDSLVIHWPGSAIPQVETGIPVNTYATYKLDSSYLSLITGVNELSELELQIFPNPTEDIISILSNDIAVNAAQLFSMDGTLLYSMKDKKIENIDLTHLASGIYLLRLKTKNAHMTRTIIKQ